MHLPLCFCADLKPIALSTKLVIVMQYKEFHTITNSGFLAERLLPNSEIRFRGSPNKTTPKLNDLLLPEAQAAVLYPTASAKTLDHAYPLAENPIKTLVVLDGNWGQASKMVRRHPVLQKLPKVKLAPGAPSKYHLRKNQIPGNVCTFEAIARALGVLENSQIQSQLEHHLDQMVTRHQYIRGRIPKADLAH